MLIFEDNMQKKMNKNMEKLPCGQFCETTYHIECIYYNAKKTDSYGDGYCMKRGGYKRPFENTSCDDWIAK